jgi:GAF domain-containing protein
MKRSADHSAMIAAVYGALAESGPDDRALLTSFTRLAQTVFSAAASSILLLDQSSAELVFEAVSGEGEEFLIGTRFPAGRGIAGWVLATGEPMTVDDLAHSNLFARDIAENTGYVPDCIMAVPVACRDDVIGVLQVLDPRRHPGSRPGMADLDLLMLIAAQAGLSLHSLITGRTAQHALVAEGAEYEQLASLVGLLAAMRPEHRAAGLRLVDSLHGLVMSLVSAEESAGR